MNFLIYFELYCSYLLLKKNYNFMRRSNFPAQKSHINGSKDEIFQIRLRNTGGNLF